MAPTGPVPREQHDRLVESLVACLDAAAYFNYGVAAQRLGIEPTALHQRVHRAREYVRELEQARLRRAASSGQQQQAAAPASGTGPGEVVAPAAQGQVQGNQEEEIPVDPALTQGTEEK